MVVPLADLFGFFLGSAHVVRLMLSKVAYAFAGYVCHARTATDEARERPHNSFLAARVARRVVCALVFQLSDPHGKVADLCAHLFFARLRVVCVSVRQPPGIPRKAKAGDY
jgi:hypothetical protein